MHIDEPVKRDRIEVFSIVKCVGLLGIIGYPSGALHSWFVGGQSCSCYNGFQPCLLTISSSKLYPHQSTTQFGIGDFELQLQNPQCGESWSKSTGSSSFSLLKIGLFGGIYSFSKQPILQWEFQDPKMEVPYFRPYFLGIFPYIALKNRPYIG